MTAISSRPQIWLVKVIKTLTPACIRTKHLLVRTSSKPKKFSKLYQTSSRRKELARKRQRSRLDNKQSEEKKTDSRRKQKESRLQMLLHIKNISRSRKYSAEVEKMLRKFDMEQNKVLLTDFVFNALMERLVYASCLSF